MKALALALICLSLSSCAAPLLLGVKSYKSGDTQIDFITGADFTVGANGLNQVDNRRGIR